MPAFVYEAVDDTGGRHRGTEEAATSSEVTRILKRRGLLVLDVSETEASRKPVFGRRRAVLEVTGALASLLASGLPLARALEVAEGLVGGGVSEALAAVRHRVERGDALHEALSDHSRLFPPVYLGVVRAGHRAGNLAGAFAQLESQLEREQALRSKLLSASIYPAVLATVGGVAVVLLTLFVLPRFAELLMDAGAELPTSTRVLLSVSDAAVGVWPALVISPPVVALVGSVWLSTDSGRRLGAQILLALPGVRALRRQALAGRFARLTNVLVAGGAPLLSALEDAAGSIGDPLARDEIVRIRLRIREGASLHMALGETDLFPPLLGRLVGVGEEAGRLAEYLDKAADLFEARVARIMERLAILAEPAMILAFGALVGLVALSLLQAIYSVNAGAF